jgi:hypothetical protein
VKPLAAVATLIIIVMAGCSPDPSAGAPLVGVGHSLASGFGGESWVGSLDRPAETAGWAGAGFAHRGMEGLALPAAVRIYILLNGAPEQVAIVAGVNDAVGAEPIDDVIAGIRELDAYLRAEGIDAVWITPPGTTNPAYNTRLVPVIDALVDEVGAHDCTTPMGNPIRAEYTNDGTHLTTAGATALADCVEGHLDDNPPPSSTTTSTSTTSTPTSSTTTTTTTVP